MIKWLGPFTLVVVVSALAALPLLLNPGFLNTRGGGDSPFLLFRLQQLYTALAQGVFPVRWMPDAAFGLGYPFFNYYAALPLYVAALFKFLGASYGLALKLTHLGGFLLAAFGMYGWIRSLGFNRWPAWLAATVYTFAPFHLVNVYVRGDSLNEFWAMGLYPLCLWAVQRINNHAKRPITNKLSVISYQIIPLAFSYAALILTHNISALIFSPFLGLYILANSFHAKQTGSNRSASARFACLLLASRAFSIMFGLALSAFFWLPALREADFGQLAPVTQGYFHYSNHFRSFDLIQPSLFFNFDVGSATSTPFALGLAQAALTLVALLFALTSAIRKAHNTSRFTFVIAHLPHAVVILSFFISIFMLTPLSRPLWDTLPLLPFVQFPWRFLSVQALFASALIAFSVQPSPASQQPTANPGVVVRITNYAIAALSLVTCALSIGALRPDFIPITDSDVTAERLQTYEYFTGNIGTTISYEYLPKWVQPRPYSSGEYIFGPANVELKIFDGQAIGARTDKRAASQTWRITVDSDSASLAVPLYYWPGWSATADGQPLEIHPADQGLGWIAFDLPKGEHTLELKLGDTDLRRNASLVSIVALLVVVFLVQPWRLFRTSFASFAMLAPFRGSRLNTFLLSLFIVSLLIVSFLGRYLNSQAKPLGAASMDFDQQGYLYSSAVTFGNGDILQGYNYSADTLQPGDTLALAFQWQATHPATYTLDLVSPAEHLLHFPATFASVSGLAQGQSALTLPIPNDLPTGVYLLRLTLIQDARLLAPAFTANNQPRGSLYLRPIRIIRNSESPLLPITANSFPIPLISLSATQSTPTSLQINLGWQPTAPIPANYLLALRLHDTTGVELAALDTPPTGGLYPTSAWRVGELIPDHFNFDLPLGLPPGDYPLTITLYHPTDLSVAGTVTLPIQLTQWTPPPGTEPLHRFTETLSLQDLTLPDSARVGDRLTFTARWNSLAQFDQDLTARWSAVSQNGEIVAVAEQPLAVIPTSQWAAGALVLSRPFIKLPLAAKPGDYVLNVQLLDHSGDLLSPPVAVGKLTLTPGNRTATLPPMQFQSQATFGPLRLAGYDPALTANALTLTLHYQTTEALATDYKYFVHIFNPADETIAAQTDGFPQIPTSQLEENEVLNLRLEIPLTDLVPGTVYNIGVGWYDPATGNRLGDRVILDQGVTKP